VLEQTELGKWDEDRPGGGHRGGETGVTEYHYLLHVINCSMYVMDLCNKIVSRFPLSMSYTIYIGRIATVTVTLTSQVFGVSYTTVRVMLIQWYYFTVTYWEYRNRKPVFCLLQYLYSPVSVDLCWKAFAWWSDNHGLESKFCNGCVHPLRCKKKNKANCPVYKYSASRNDSLFKELVHWGHLTFKHRRNIFDIFT
jgi:hypothetical protein